LTLWEKSYENSSAEEDLKQLCLTIVRHAFVNQNIFFLDRFTKRAQYFFNEKQPDFAQFIYVMQFMCKLLENQPLQANQVIYQANVNLMIDDNPELKNFVNSHELA